MLAQLQPKAYAPIAPRRLAFLGLGVMGAPMAAHLALAGHHVTVYNRSPARATAWVEAVTALGAPGELRHAATARGAAAGADVVLCCVGGDDDVRAVLLGEAGALGRMAPGTVFADHSTTSAQAARGLAQTCQAAGVFFLDAPVSGSQIGARKGLLTVMCGGQPQAFERVVPVMAAYARAVTLLGGSGSGQLAKMVNQICLAGTVQGLAEAIAFGQRAGLDMPAVLGALGQGAAQSWQMDQCGPSMVAGQFDHGFAVDLARKDMGLVLDEARRNGARLPVAALVDQFYADLQQPCSRRWDISSLVTRLL